MVKIIGIQGIAGSGKTTLTRALGKALNATTLFWDDFDPISTGPSDYIEWFKTSKDHNDWQYGKLAEVLQSLKEGKSLTCPATHRVLIPTKYVIFDAPLGYDHKATGQWIDFLVYLDTPPDIALARRLYRDYQPNAKRNDNDILEEIFHYLESARPVFMAAYEMKDKADLILDGGQPPEILVLSVLDYLNEQKQDLKMSSYTVEFVDQLPENVEEKMSKDLAEYESSHGVDVNYKKFSLLLKSREGEVFGVINAFTAFAEVYVDDIWVSKPFRGKGFGKKLLQALENHFKGKGFNNINLVTSAFQAPTFYKKCGFAPEFVRENKENPKLTKTFFIKYFDDKTQTQGVLKEAKGSS